MRKVIRNALWIVGLSWMLVTGAVAEDIKLSDLDRIYRLQNIQTPPPVIFDLGGEDVSYDRKLGAFVSAKEESKRQTVMRPLISMLPEPIPPPPNRTPLIAVVIDDMGVDVKRSARAVKNLPAAVTLAYLPYSKNIRGQVASAKEQGHEVMLHMPWQPDRDTADPGPNHLSTGMTAERLQKNVVANLDGFEGYDGVNNHMGSRFSRFRPGLAIVMAEIKKRGVFFLDSKTTPDSAAEKVAQEYGVPVTHRDVFLDHDEDPQMVGSSLQEVENVARRKGSAVAIGHPKDVTLDNLEPWLATLESKGFRLAPLSDVLKFREDARVASITRKK